MAAGGLIVVGVDGSKESRQALVWAFEQCRAHGLRLLVVTTWTVPPILLDFGAVAWGADDSPEVVAEAERMLRELIAEIAPSYPEVAVQQHVVAGNPALELIRLSKEAEAVVVGAKGHGGFTGMLIGSVSQHVLAHSACTVIVVR